MFYTFNGWTQNKIELTLSSNFNTCGPHSFIEPGIKLGQFELFGGIHSQYSLARSIYRYQLFGYQIGANWFFIDRNHKYYIGVSYYNAKGQIYGARPWGMHIPAEIASPDPGPERSTFLNNDINLSFGANWNLIGKLYTCLELGASYAYYEWRHNGEITTIQQGVNKIFPVFFKHGFKYYLNKTN